MPASMLCKFPEEYNFMIKFQIDLDVHSSLTALSLLLADIFPGGFSGKR